MNHSTKELFSISPETLSIRDLLSDLLEQKWLILSITLLIMTLGMGFICIKKPIYQTNVLIQVENSQKTNMGVLGSIMHEMNAVTGTIANGDEAAIQTVLIRSRYILTPVVNALNLNINAMPARHSWTDYLFSAREKIHVKVLTVPFSLLNHSMQLIYDKPDHYQLYLGNEFLLAGSLHQLVNDRKHAITIQVDALQATPGTTFSVVKHTDESIIEELIANIQIKDLGSIGKRPEKTGVLEISMNDTDPQAAIAILNEIAAVIQAKDIAQKSIEAAKTLKFLNQQLPIVQADLQKAEINLNRYRATSGKIDSRMQTQALLIKLGDIEKQLMTLQLNKPNMQRNYTLDHPFMISLNQKEADLKQLRKQIQNKLKTLPSSDQIATSLMREVKVKNSLYLILLNRIQELNVTKAATVSNVHILSLASMPDTPLSINLVLTFAATLILGLMLGSSIVFIRNAMRQRISDPQWLERNMNLINLAIIPYSKKQAHNTAKDKAKQIRNVPLLAANKSNDISIEALRSLRTSLQVLLLNETSNVIAIMGISPGVGKSFISANLAYLLAETGKRVLLIDGDIRRGHLQEYFSLKRDVGLSELIKGTVAIENALRKTSHQNLTFLSTGTLPSNPAELLMEKNFKELLNLFSLQFDFIVIDTAPVLAVTDGSIIGALSGTRFLVIGANEHQPDEIDIAVKRLASANAKLNGYIYNYIRPRKHGSKYGYRYKYDYTALADHA